MYQVFYDGELIYDPRGANCAEPGDETYALIDGSLDLAVGSAGTLTMTLAGGHPMISSMQPRLGTVKVVELLGNTASTVFLGRIIRDTLNFDNSHTYECEGRLACLNDTVMAPYSFPSNYESDADYQTAVTNQTVPAYWLGKLLEIHNGMAWNSENQIQLGTVTVTGGSFVRSSESWENMWRTITGDLPDSTLGGNLVVRYVGDVAYLDYLADFTAQSAQTVDFSENLIDVTRTNYSGDYFNGVIPIGEDGLTCSAVPNGYYGTNNQLYKSGSYIVTPAERDAGFGNVMRIVHFDGITTAAELVNKAVALLESVAFVDEIEVSAADLSGVDASIPAWHLAELLTINNPPQNMRAAYAIVGLGIDILGDVTTKLTLGARAATMSGTSRGGTGSGGAVITGAVTGVKGNAESAYRDGDVNLTPANIGAVNKAGDSMTGELGIGTSSYADRVKLRATDDGRGNIRIFRADGTMAANIYASSGGAEIDLLDASATTRAALYINTTNGGILNLKDMQGNSTTLNRTQLAALLAML